MRSKSTDRGIVLWLLAALFVETLLLLWHLDIVSFGARGEPTGAKLAGQIVHSENDLRRRGVNSLVWEKTETKESVYFYDSLLTLSQSTARLDLEHGTEVELSENTLVTIEPENTKAGGEIRLKFTRGSLQARNPFRPAQIDAPEFSLAVGAGSDLQLRQVNDGEFEVRVNKGEALVHGANGEHRVNSTSLLRVNRGHGKTFKLEQGLKFIKPPSRRIYVHGDRARVALQWDGPVRELVLQKTGAPEKVERVEGAGGELELETGHHLIYPRDANGSTGAPVDVEIWRAPTLHLITPLPRNRMRTDEQAFFLWTRLPEASGYVWHARGPAGVQEAEGVGNSYSTRFGVEGDAFWSVWALDKQGFRIPPLYEYPLYIREAPLEAPKLKTPKLRRPASKDGRGAWLWNQIFPRAHADDGTDFEAVFEWEQVEGADVYWIEVSETPDFRTPIVSAKVEATQFVWAKAKKRIYYWRVASGARAGRMGLFSEPSTLEPEQLTQVSEPPPAPPMTEEKPVEKTEAPAAVAAPSAPEPIVAEEDLPREHEPHRARFLWRGGYQAVQAKAPEDVSATLSGGSAISFAAEVDAGLEGARWWRVSARYASATFTPVPKDDYPFQEDVSVMSANVGLTAMRAYSPWGFGLNAVMMPKIERTGLESIGGGTQGALGFHLQAVKQIWHCEYRGEASMLIGEGMGVGMSHRFLAKPWSERGFLLGVELEALYFFDNSYHTLTADGWFQLGFQF